MTSHVVRSVDRNDLEDLVRNCDYPAMRDNPLTRTMFPSTNLETEEEEIRWHTLSFRNTLETDPDAHFVKICSHEGTSIAFSLWILDQFCPNPGHHTHLARQFPINLPSSLDQHAWRELSNKLRVEKRRVLKPYTVIWRLCILSVHPQYQRQGYASQVLHWGCAQADIHQYTSFAMASPVAVSLYKRFGYRAVGRVSSSFGEFTSMLREPERIDKNIDAKTSEDK